MTHLTLHRSSQERAIALPEPRCGEISVRPATMDDLPFIDGLQKMHTKMVGWMPRGQLETYITRGQVLVAEQNVHRGDRGERGEEHSGLGSSHSHSASASSACSAVNSPLGYCISQDKYLKREELGIVYQLNVLPGKQRGLIGATLIREVFHRAAYGCKLFCCWCAQDLEANHFWESIGFVPLAFRTGSRKAGQKKEPRIHIFWQRRIREGDVETPYWFPSETSGGAVRENRLVLPIPPGTHWSDAKPAVLPGMEMVNVLPEGHEPVKRKKKVKEAAVQEVQPTRPCNGLWFPPPPPPPPTPEEIAKAKEEKKKAQAKRPKFKNDPKLVAAARELRDRYTEQINEGLLLPPSACGKYDVSRALEAAPSAMRGGPDQVRLLDAA